MFNRKVMWICLPVCLVLMLSLVACTRTADNDVPPDTTTAVTTTTTTSSVAETTVDTNTTTKPVASTTAPIPTNPDTGLPQYVPGSIKLGYYENQMFVDLRRPYRRVYNNLNMRSCLDGLVSAQQRDDWYYNEYLKDNPYGKEKECIYVAFIKKFGIKREQFDVAVSDYVERSIQNGVDLTDELYEAPNADIIYTFDDAIIREYYRYDWEIMERYEGDLDQISEYFAQMTTSAS